MNGGRRRTSIIDRHVIDLIEEYAGIGNRNGGVDFEKIGFPTIRIKVDYYGRRNARVYETDS